MAADQEHSGGHLIVNDSTDDTEERYQEEKEMNLMRSSRPELGNWQRQQASGKHPGGYENVP